ncbi:PREDICTED: heterogeneous nuclear ribonucleoprotein U-like protein 2 [Ceratosolen solmsi marchali]|uniref:Heterogeneous nuclear ribonucleoprotein U-like protein 2 n=1 Tax=Ceratosolen solmsi marchali TaxID=326594 RepID=A0AAJ6YQA9_9HYME|nr:PREDICTED: heterogeneous nuclear ribonucleoprotein U-like protein 2 [Ceratosolen solmsi marchali]
MDPAKLKVVELRAELSKRGLDSKGNKPVLVERLRQALEEEKADPKIHVESTEKLEQSESEDEGSHTESKSPELAKLPPRTPSRSSRHASREPTTPARTPTRRSTSRSSLSRQSPAKITLTEAQNENVSTIESIAKEDKLSPRKDDVALTSKKEIFPLSPIKEAVSPSATDIELATTPQKEATSSILIMDTDTGSEILQKEAESAIPVTEVSTISSKTENILSNEIPKVEKDENFDIVKEAEKHEHEKSQEITRRSIDEIVQINAQSPVKSPTRCPIKSVTQSPIKATPSSPTKLSTESPIKSTSETSYVPVSDNPIEPTVQSPINTTKDSPTKSVIQNVTSSTIQSPINTDIPSPVKSIIQSPIKCPVTQKEEEEEAVSPNKKSDEPMEVVRNVEQESLDKSTDESTDQVNDTQSMETDDQHDDKNEKSDDKSEDRKRKRSPSYREETSRAPPIARPENEPSYDDNALLLSWYDSDLNLVIDTTQYFSASPMQGDGFNFMWAGVRASYGFTKGKVFYEARVNARFDKIITPAPPAPNTPNSGGAIPIDEDIPSVLRLGWSTLDTSLQLGEVKLSYGYDSTGKKSTNNEFVEYGKTFAKDDVVGCFADFETDGNVILTYTINGENQGPAFILKKEDLQNKALFPHVLSKNCSFTVNLGQEENWNDNILDEYISVGKVDLNDRITGPRRPEKREDCEVILLCGLPFSGKTSWARKHVTEHPEKYYSVLGTHNLIEKMTVDGAPLKESYKGRWETVVDKCSRALTKLLDSAPSRRRNYILDQQANVYGSAQKRKTRNFYGFHRKAVVLVPTDEEFKARIAKRKEEPDGEEIRESSILEVKANFSAPTVGDSFEEVIWAELDEEEGKKLIEAYNMEGKTAGYGQNTQQPSKRSRFDNGQKDRNNRDNRGGHRRSGYTDRRNSGAWRGGNGGGRGGWRDGGRMRGGPIRHGAGYGLPSIGRGRGAVPPPRSGANDRRSMNERNRPVGAYRPGAWNAMGYQGSQHGSSVVWSNQSNWQGQSQGTWSCLQGASSTWNQHQQQSNWSGAGNNWKNYGQNSYGQSTGGGGSGGGYGQQTGSGYGNGNWNNWSPQYYNQYWGGSGQQQQTGGQTQTTTGSGGGGQAASKK